MLCLVWMATRAVLQNEQMVMMMTPMTYQHVFPVHEQACRADLLLVGDEMARCWQPHTNLSEACGRWRTVLSCLYHPMFIGVWLNTTYHPESNRVSRVLTISAPDEALHCACALYKANTSHADCWCSSMYSFDSVRSSTCILVSIYSGRHRW